MAANWYKIFNKTDFVAEALVSRTLVLTLIGIGETTFEVFVGNHVSVLFDDVFLPIGLLDQNPYVRDGYAVYENDAGDIYFGIGDA